jgi:hypothetical protein
VQEIEAFEKENEMNHTQIFAAADENGGVKADENGAPVGPFEAHYLPQLALHLEDSDGKLKKSKSSKFYQVGAPGPTVGEDDRKLYILPSQLKWKGIFKVLPRSIVDSSQTLVKAMTMEVFNMLVPLLSQPKELAAKPAAQILKVNEEDPKDWLPDDWIDFLENGPKPPAAPQGAATPGQAQAQGVGGPAGIVPPGQAAPLNPGQGAGATIQGATGMKGPQAATIVPGSPAPDLQQLMGGKGGGQIFKTGLK